MLLYQNTTLSLESHILQTFLVLKKYFFPNDQKNEHFAALDGLRGFAVLLVLFSHAALLGLHPTRWFSMDGLGTYGVQLFFVLSAYLLDRQIASMLMQGKADTLYWLNYALRRFLRIFPLFFLSLLLYYYLTVHVKGNMVFGHTITPKDIWQHLLLLKGEGFYWSIPVEFKYYCLSPFIMLVCHYWLKWDLRKVVPFFILLVAGTLAAKYSLNLSKISTTLYLNVFLVGTMLSVVELQKQTELLALQKRYGWLIELVGILALLAIFYSFKKDFNLAFKNAILWGIVLFAAKYGYGIIRYVFSFTFLRLWGVVSFSAYLLHRSVLGYVKYVSPFPEKTKIWVFVLLALMAALISYLLIEKPLSNINLYKLLAKPSKKVLENKNKNE